LRGHDQEGLGHFVSILAQRHCRSASISSGALHLGGARLISSASRNWKNGAELGVKGAVAWIVDQRATNPDGSMSGVTGCVKTDLDAGGQRTQGQGLGNPGTPFGAGRAVGDEGDQEPVDQIFLATITRPIPVARARPRCLFAGRRRRGRRLTWP